MMPGMKLNGLYARQKPLLEHLSPVSRVRHPAAEKVADHTSIISIFCLTRHKIKYLKGKEKIF
jgi:hypothetical protein